MGNYASWQCDECGAGECFYQGGGMLGFDNPELVDKARAGGLGPAVKMLLTDGVPEGWTLFDERVFYRCPECGTPVPGTVTRIDDGSGNWLMFHASPEACASCGGELEFWDDKVPMTSDELLNRCMGYVEGGCPKCSGKVQMDVGNWD